MSSRQRGGIETFERLLNWQRGDAQSQRLAFSLIAQEGYHIDPIHSLGGPDGGKDAFAYKADSKYVVAVYFPNGKKTFAEILTKFRHDFKGVESNNASGIIFFVNQYLTQSERNKIRIRGTRKNSRDISQRANIKPAQQTC
ncbi:MAG: hypothetical protein QM758_08090 [Armatimonas sp.]